MRGYLLTSIFFALALSIDGFGMGLSYGLRRMRITFFPLSIICISSGLAITISMCCGGFLASFLAERVAAVLGAVLLMLVGMWIVRQNYFLTLLGPYLSRLDAERVGLVLEILIEPKRADLNRSGEIEANEAVLLGVALALDAIGAGFGAALAGYSLVWTPILVAVVEFLMINCGLLLGRKLSFGEFNKALTFVPGVMIILLGLVKLICG